MRTLLKWGGIALAALVLISIGAAIGGGDMDQADDRATVTEETPGPAADDTPEPQDTPEPDPPPIPDPEATYKLNCDYLLGDFGDSGDPAAGYRFVGGGTLRNTGNVAVKAQVVFRWEQLGSTPVSEKEVVRLGIGKTRRVNVTIPVSDDQIDLHQSADGECSAKARIVDTYGRVRDLP